MTHDTIQRLARERAIQRLSPSQAMEAGFVLAEMTLDEARSFRPSGVESVAGGESVKTNAEETAR
jgi:hypothetical protein